MKSARWSVARTLAARPARRRRDSSGVESNNVEHRNSLGSRHLRHRPYLPAPVRHYPARRTGTIEPPQSRSGCVKRHTGGYHSSSHIRHELILNQRELGKLFGLSAFNIAILGADDSGTDGFTDDFVDAAPRYVIAVGIVLAAWLGASLVKRVLRPRLADRRTESFGRVVSKLISYLVIAVGVLVAAVVVFPKFNPVDVLAGLGIFSIAIGFAFQDILSNLLAGILLLIREPFQSGDEIEVSGQHGIVERITIRETQIKTYDGEKVLIPNAEVYQNVIRVQTAYGPKRTALAIGLDDWEDFDRATDVILGALDDIDGIADDPAPQAYFTHFADSTTNLDLRYWTDPQQSEVRRIQDQVVRKVGKALKEADISMPSPIREIDVRDSVEDLVAQASNGSRSTSPDGSGTENSSTAPSN